MTSNIIRTPSQRLVILGAGAFAEDIADVVAEDDQFEIVAFVEGVDRGRCGAVLAGRPVIWIDELRKISRSCKGIGAIGTPKRRSFIYEAAEMGLEFARVVHGTAQVSATSVLGVGAIVSRGVIIAARCRIGDHVIVNRGCLIGHHCDVEEFATIGPGANIAGGVTIGAGAYIGMAAVIREKIRIGQGAVVGAGAVVTRDVPDHVTVIGMPARVVGGAQSAK